ncbi:MAG: aminotransferase class I/II-fold pyridoxal phosphate-dependent enzyme [Candidatus Limnocylindria bacterium]
MVARLFLAPRHVVVTVVTVVTVARVERPFSQCGLERWFAANATARIDLASSGAPARSLADLLSWADPSERSRIDKMSLGYGAGEGSLPLRSAIAAAHPTVRPDDVAVTCGAIEALHLSLAALVAPGDDVIVQEPMYPAAVGIAEGRGARVVPWRLVPESGFRASIDELGDLVTPRTRVVVIAQPNGPSGSILERDDLRALAGVLAPRGVWLLSDEVYRDLVLEPGLSVCSAAEIYERAVTVGDVSKPYGLGGLRIGWLISRDPDLRQRIAAHRDYTTISVPTISDALATIAIRHGQELLAKPLRNARSNLRQLEGIRRRTSLSFTTPRAGVTAFVRLPHAEEAQRRLARQGVLMVPGALFGHPDRVRIGLAGSPAEFESGMRHLEQVA